jgi:hypothetical protein
VHTYKVRVHQIGFVGFITKADHYDDFEVTSTESLQAFAKRLALEGFHDPNSARWIMPGAIMWVDPQD